MIGYDPIIKWGWKALLSLCSPTTGECGLRMVSCAAQWVRDRRRRKLRWWLIICALSRNYVCISLHESPRIMNNGKINNNNTIICVCVSTGNCRVPWFLGWTIPSTGGATRWAQITFSSLKELRRKGKVHGSSFHPRGRSEPSTWSETVLTMHNARFYC